MFSHANNVAHIDEGYETREKAMERHSLEKTNKHPTKAYLLLGLVGISLGGLVGAIAGSFMYAQHYLIEFIWEFIPHQLGGGGGGR